MNRNTLQFEKDFLDNLQLKIIYSAYTHCWEDWKDLNYIPDYNKFYFICEGEGLIKIGEKEFYPQKGQLVLMPAGVLQSYSAINKNTFKKYWCHFNAKIGDINIFDFMDIPYIINVTDFDKLKNLFEGLVSLSNSQKIFSIMQEKAILLEIISVYLKDAQIDNLRFTKFSYLEKLNNVLKYVQEHYSENLTVETLANLAHFHPNYFTNMFKKYMGMPPIQYINKIRIEKAKYLIKTTDLHINEIALKTGFCDVYYFSKCFKNYVGYSPTEFRNI